MGRVLSLIRGRRGALAALAVLLGAIVLAPFIGALAAYAPGSVCAAHQWVAGITMGSGAASAISCAQPAAADVSGLAASATTDTTNAGNISSGTLAAARLPGSGATTVAGQACTLGAACGLSSLTASLGANVTMTAQNTYYDGPSVAQGATGTWFASGTVTLTGNTNDAVVCKLWDGGSKIAGSTVGSLGAGSAVASISLSGQVASPGGNLRISCENASSTAGSIRANQSAAGADSTITALRIN